MPLNVYVSENVHGRPNIPSLKQEFSPINTCKNANIFRQVILV